MDGLIFKSFRNVFITCHSTNSVSNEDWQTYLAAYVEHCRKHPNAASLVFSAGGNPNPVQRKQLMDKLKKFHIKTAVLSDDIFVRGVVTAFSWLGASKQIKAFRSNALKQALAHLNVNESLLPEIDDLLAQMKNIIKAI